MTDGLHKRRLTRAARFWRLLSSTLDPRAWAHMIKIVNFYNYTHLQELRRAEVARSANISPTAGFANGHNLRIGARVTVGAHCQLWAGPGFAKIVLGNDTLLAPDVMMTAASYRYDDGSPVAQQAMNEADILIGQDCWIGRGTTILAGAELGDGTIVGANSVVKGRFPPGSIIAGAPARVIGSRRMSGAAAGGAQDCA